MNLNNFFSQSKLDQYAAYLKSTSLSDASLKRKLSSLSSFQKFLVKNNLIENVRADRCVCPSLGEHTDLPVQNNLKPNLISKIFKKTKLDKLSNFQLDKLKSSFLFRYLIIFSLFVIGLGLGFTLYRQAFAQSTKNFAYTTASNPIVAKRQLSFQGRLTDSSGNPITSSTNIVFKLYNTETVGTGTSLYTSATGNSQTVTPDENGIFSVVIGKTHGTEIPDSVFTENSAVYLEITAGNEVMSPRQPIATVAYALNSETLQGLPPSASGLKNTVLVVDGLGNINLGETSPTIKSTSGTMGIEAQAVLIKATDGSGGNITINPDANGEIKLVTEGTGVSDGFINATNANLASGNLFNASINNDNRGYKFINFSNYDISTTQLTSRFSVDAYGNTNVGGTLSTINLAVGSSDLVNNLNSDLLDGQHSNYFVNIGQTGSLPYDNYNHWDLQTNGVGNTAILSGNAVNFINGVGISISQTGSVITIDNTSIGTTYTAGVGLTLSSTNVFSLDLASANTWTALQNLSAGATISNLSVGGTFLSVGSTNTVINLSANYLNGKSDTYFLGVGSTDNFITTLTAGTDISITGSGIGRTINDTSTLATITGREASTSTLLSLLGGAYFGSTSQSILKNDGSVGIGTTNPGAYKLNVNGSMNLASGQTYNIGGAQINLNNLSDVLISTPITDQILRYNGTSWVNGAETTVNGGAGVDLFYVDSPSDISTYTILNKTPDAGGEIDETVTANNNRVLFDSYASPLPGFGGTQIDPGVWTFDIWAYVNDITSGNSSIDIDVYKRTTDGTETLLFSVNSGTLDTTLGLNPNVVTTIQQAFPINSTDRLVTKVYGKTTAVANRTIHFVHGGTSHYSHLNTPLVVRHNDLAGLQGGTASEYYHLTAAEYTGSGTGVFARINSPTFTGNFGIGGTDSNYSFHTTTNGRFDTNLEVGSTLTTTTLKATNAQDTTMITDLNADLLDGQHSSYFVNIGQTGNFITTLTAGTDISITGSGIGRTINDTSTLDTVIGRGASTTKQITIGYSGAPFVLSSGDTSTVTNLSADYLDGFNSDYFVNIGQTGNFITTISVGASGLSVTGSGIGRTLTNTGLVDITNSTLTRSGSDGTYTVGLNLGNANTWTAIQNLSAGATISNLSIGGTFLSVGSTNLVTNLNADLLDGQHSTYFVNIGQTGSLPYVNNTTNTTLTRSGTGPFTLGLNLASANTWTAIQNLSAGATISTLSTTGNASIGGTLAVTGRSTFAQNVFVNAGGIGVTGNSVFTNNLTIGDTLTLSQGAQDGYVLTSDASGNAKWSVGSGTTYTAGVGLTLSSTNVFSLDLASANTWTALQNLSAGATISNLSVGGTFLSVGSTNTVTNLSADYLDGFNSDYFVNIGQTGNFITTISVGASGLSVTGSGIGRTLTNTGLVDITNSTLTRSGSDGTYTVGLNLGNANTWTAIQNLSAGATISNLSIGGTFLSVGSTNLVTNLNADLLDGYHASAFEVPLTFTNGLTRTSNDIHLGGALTEDTRLNIGSTEALYIQFATGNVGIGTTNPVAKLQVSGLNNTSILLQSAVADATESTATLFFSTLSGATDEFKKNAIIAHRSSSATWGKSDLIFAVRTLDDGVNADISDAKLTISGSTGNVGIGTTAPTQKLDVNGWANITSGIGIGATDNAFSFHTTTNGRFDTNLEVGSTLTTTTLKATNAQDTTMITDLNADLLDGYHASSFEVPLTFSNGLTRTINDIHLGGALTEDTRLNIGSTEALYIQFATGNVGIGTTNPTEKLEVIGNVKAQKFYDQDNPLYYLDPSNASSTSSSLSLTTSGSIRFNSDVGGTHIVASSASRIQNFTNGLLLGVSTSTSGNIVGWDNNLFLNVSGNIGIGTTSPNAKLQINSPISQAYASVLSLRQGASPTYGFDFLQDDLTTGDLQLNRVNAGTSSPMMTFQRNTGNVGIGTTNPTESLDVIGNIKASKFYDQDNPLYFIDPANASSNNASLSLTTSGSIRFNSDVGGTHIVASSASRIQNYPNGLLLGVSTSTSGNIVGWDNNLFLNVSGNVGIGTTGPTSPLTIAKTLSANQTYLNFDNVTNTKYNWGMNWSVLGATNINVAKIEAIYPADDNIGLAFSTYGSAGLGERVRIDKEGNVGIGTTNPLAKLSIGNGSLVDSNVPVQISAGGTRSYYGVNRSDGAYGTLLGWDTTFGGSVVRSINAADSLTFIVNNTNQAMTITPTSGNVGIGTASPGAKLQVEGLSVHTHDITLANAYTSAIFSATQNTTHYGIYMGADASSGDAWIQVDNAATAYNLLLNPLGGKVGIGTVSPSTKTHVYGTLTVEPLGITNSWSEGIRIGNASNNYSIVNFGANPASATGVQANQWWIGKDGVDNGFSIYGNTYGGNAFHILPSGKVGIGTDTPAAKLEVGGGGETARFSGGAAPYITIGNGTGGSTTGSYIQWDDTKDKMYISPHGLQAMTINSSGQVDVRSNSGNGGYISSGGYGGTGAAAYFPSGLWANGGTNWIYGGTYFNSSLTGITYLEASGMITASAYNSRPGVNGTPTGSHMNTHWTGGCVQQWVDITNVGNWNCASDERLKKNIQSFTDTKGLAAINQLNPVTFNWNLVGESVTDQYGFIAQQVRNIFPDLVTNTGMITELTPDGMLRINYEGLIPVAIKGIQEVDAKLVKVENDLTLTSIGEVSVNYNVSDEVLASLGYDGAKNEIEAATYSLTDSTGAIVTRISQFSEIASAKIKAGLISATNIITKNLIAEKINTKELISPRANIDELTATTATISGTLVTSDIQTTSITTDNLVANEATISTLYADNIISKEGSFGDLMAQKVGAVRDELKKLITDNEASSSAITGTSIASLTSDWSMNIASDSAKIEGDLTISNNLVIGAKLLVNGDTQLANAFITGTFSAGEVSIKDNFIQTTNTALYIQPSNAGSIHMMGDTLVIADNGEVQINGNLAVSGSLFANLITASEIQTQKLTATEINSNQVKIATDSAQTIIADPGFAALATSSANLTSNATAGTATLPAGKTEIVINNNKITNNSMVYITPVGSTKNQVPYIKAKVISASESYFTIALDNPLDQDIEINWWIIN